MASDSTRSSGTVLDIELNEHEQVSPLTDEEIRIKPWKYIGYKGYADLLSSDDDLFILRRFNTLNVRVILAQQDRLSKLEHELAEVDERNSKRDAPDVNNGTIRDDIEERKLLLDDIRKEIHRYSLSYHSSHKSQVASMFLLVMSFAMVAKPFEALGVTAAYVMTISSSHRYLTRNILTSLQVYRRAHGIHAAWIRLVPGDWTESSHDGLICKNTSIFPPHFK